MVSEDVHSDAINYTSEEMSHSLLTQGNYYFFSFMISIPYFAIKQIMICMTVNSIFYPTYIEIPV